MLSLLHKHEIAEASKSVSRSEATRRSDLLLRAGLVREAKNNSWKEKICKNSAFAQSQFLLLVNNLN